MTTLSTHAVEKSVAKITVAFTDETGAAVTPSSANWTLTDGIGTVVNGRSAVTISGLSTSAAIVLSGNDLALGGAYLGRERVLTIQYTYTSSIGTITANAECRFVIDDLVAVS